jgi:hypothetical protein
MECNFPEKKNVTKIRRMVEDLFLKNGSVPDNAHFIDKDRR